MTHMVDAHILTLMYMYTHYSPNTSLNVRMSFLFVLNLTYISERAIGSNSNGYKRTCFVRPPQWVIKKKRFDFTVPFKP